jgi:hypothetical protein
MFNGLVDSAKVWAQRGSSSKSLGCSTHHHHTDQDIANERIEQQLKENEEYNL